MTYKKKNKILNLIATTLIAFAVLLALFFRNRNSNALNDPTPTITNKSSDVDLQNKQTLTSETNPERLDEQLPYIAKDPVTSTINPSTVPNDISEDMGQQLSAPPPELPEDLKAQLEAPPPELPEDLKAQLEAPPPELPEDLKAQLEAPPPELPEDIKRALSSPPRVVSLDEVNNPQN